MINQEEKWDIMKTFIIFYFVSFTFVTGLNHSPDLGDLIDHVMPSEEIKLNGSLLENGSNLVSREKDEDGTLSVSFRGAGELYISRSTGLSSGTARDLLEITQNSIGSRKEIITSIKRGGKLLSLNDTDKLDEIIKSNRQKFEVFINNKLIDFDKATIIESRYDTTVLKPHGYPEIKIVLSDDGLSVISSLSDGEVKMAITRGLNNLQLRKLRNNVYSIIALKASEITGLPEPLLELVVAGREAIVSKLNAMLRSVEYITVNGKELNLDSSKRISTSAGMVLQPENYPQIKITWRKDDKLRVESEDGEAINVIYSTGIEPVTISKIVNRLHRTITLRLGMITWSHRLFGSIPPQLEADLEELKTKIQKRTIIVDGIEVDLKKSSIIESNDDFVLYRLLNGDQLKVFYNGAVSSEGKPLILEFTPGISETQLANLFSKINQLFSTSIGFAPGNIETMLNFKSNRQILQMLMRGIKPKEIIKVDQEHIDLSNATVSKQNRDFTEFTDGRFDNLVLTKFVEGDIQIDGKGHKLFISRSTGLSLEFLNKLVVAINDVMPKKRWFYNFGQKEDKNQHRDQLQSIVDEIPSLIQEQTVSIDGQEMDFKKASILSVDDLSTIYSPESGSDVRITRYLSGDIEAIAGIGQRISIKVSHGISSQDADILIDNIKNIVGDRVTIGSKRPSSLWCSSGDLRKLMGTLLESISPKLNIFKGTNAQRTVSSRDFSNPQTKTNVIISNYKGSGKNITSKSGGTFSIDISTGLTQDVSNELIQYLVKLLSSKDDVIRMVTGSIPERKIQKIKNLLKNMIQKKILRIDSKEIPLDLDTSGDSNNLLQYLLSRYNIRLSEGKNGSILVESSNDHAVSIIIGPGLTVDQAEQMYKNIKVAFKEKFAEVTNVPVTLLDVLSSLKKYFIKSYFFSAAPPKEYIVVNGNEIIIKNVVRDENGDETFMTDDDSDQDDVKIIRKNDGTLKVSLAGSGIVDVIKLYGLDEEQVDRILKAVEFRLGLKNQMFRISSDKLFSPPEKHENLDELLKNLIASESIRVNGGRVDLNRPKVASKNEDGCSVKWFGNSNEIVATKCPNGRTSIENNNALSVELEIHPGISQQQSDYILNNLMTTIQTKSSNIKHLANYPDTFLQLLAEGRIKSLDKILYVLFPREDISVNGNMINLEPVELGPEQEYLLTEFETQPGLNIYRYNNGSIQVKLENGGAIDVHINSGLTANLLQLILRKFKVDTSKNLEPYLLILYEMLHMDFKTFLNTVGVVSRYQTSHQAPTINVTKMVDIFERELKNKIHKLLVNKEIIYIIAEKIAQKQEIFVNNQLLDLKTISPVVSTNDYTVYASNNVKITSYNNGRLVVESMKEETISVFVSGGIPQKMLASFTEMLYRYLNKIDQDIEFSEKVKEKLVQYLLTVYETAIEGISKRHRISLDHNDIILSDDLLVNENSKSKIYQIDGLSIKLDTQDGMTEVEMMTPGKLELDISSGVLLEPAVSFVGNNSLKLLVELLESTNNFETVVPLLTKLEKVAGTVLKSLERKILINGKPIDSPSIQTIESAKELKVFKDTYINGMQLTVFKSGLLVIDNNQESAVKVGVSEGLTESDLEKLLSNLERLFSKFNPVELVADVLDILPKNFFILAQNMDRVLSIMNLIQF